MQLNFDQKNFIGMEMAPEYNFQKVMLGMLTTLEVSSFSILLRINDVTNML